jgi:predicted deacylase
VPDETLCVAGQEVLPGERHQVELKLARLPDSTRVSIPAIVLRGRRDGASLWLSGAIHGDELNGVEVIRRVLEVVDPERLAGTLIAIPIVNVFGFLHQSRYLPDRRDLNRSFPGSPRGSLAARIANLFMREVVATCSHGIDLHTASNDRVNLPQVRADLDDPETLRCAQAFGANLYMHSTTRHGSLRAAAMAKGCRVLVYEAGEAQRFDENGIAVGVRGVLQVMGHLGMWEAPEGETQRAGARVESSRWVRAPLGGLFRLEVELGARIVKGQRIGVVAGVLGENPHAVKAPHDGIVIGNSLNPIVYQGDAVVHVAQLAGSADDATSR